MKLNCKVLIITALTLLTLFTPIAARDRKTVALKQIYPSERDLLPDRTLEMKVKLVSPAIAFSENLTGGIDLLLNRVAVCDYFNNIFLVECTRESSGALAVTITEYDPFEGNVSKFDYAMQCGGHKTFLFAPMPVQLQLSKDGKLIIERVFEMVNEKLPLYPTRVKATVTTDGTVTYDPTSIACGEPLTDND